MPKISVIMPVYNVEQYLRQSLDSLINQTLNDIEIVCINDGSTDKSLEILQEYAAKDDRIFVITQKNQGQGVARNKGIEIAKGEYIQFVDPDDWIELDACETLYNFAKEKNAKVVKFDYINYNDFSNEFKQHDFVKYIKKVYGYDLIRNPVYSWRNFRKGCLTKLDLHVWTYLFLTEYIKSNNIKFAPIRHCEDHLFANSSILLTDKIYFLNKHLYFYRIRCGSTVYKKSDINFCVFDGINLLKEFLICHDLYEDLKDEWLDYARISISWIYDKIPQNSIAKYEQLSLQYFNSEKEFRKFIKQQRNQRTFLESIFSIKNENINAVKHKVITILGFSFNCKPKKKFELTEGENAEN